jgi:hypothetical protein
MTEKKCCFVAYPSKPISLAETIESAIEEIKGGQVVDIEGWKSKSVSGKFIMVEICKAIESCDIFICDLTTLNHNVLFELGYAIARKKRIWILLDPNIQDSKRDYEKFKLLTTVGYIPYCNSQEIEKNFYKEKPWDDLENTIYKDAIESIITTRKQDTLLYLMSGIETESSIKLSQTVNNSQIPKIVDDPSEVRAQTLSWYAKETYNAFAVVTHFLSHAHVEWRLHNAKNSFVSGLAFGFGKNLLMLAHDPYDSPIDYRELLKIHKTAKICKNYAESWLKEIEDKYFKRETDVQQYEKELKAHSELQSITIGDPVAEHESEALHKYFIITAEYIAALKSRQSLFIGRKGQGKTAILYSLGRELKSDLRNHVCIIKPVAYELEGILQMLQQALSTSEKGFLIESFWKFLIYTELAKSVFEELDNKPVHFNYSDEEQILLSVVSENSSIIMPDFSIRLEAVVNNLKDVSKEKSKADQRAKISELLHDEVIWKLRSVLGKVLENRNKVTVLIDNLDKAWNQGSDFKTLSQLLLGLMTVSRRIEKDFQKEDRWRRPVNLSLIIFLRSDIFSQIVKHARERDKISYSRIEWSDPELLLRVLEERVMVSSGASNQDEVWSKYFCDDVIGVPIKEYLINYIIPRPRDLIYLSRAALEHAINRRHKRVEEVDIVEAQRKYSQYVLESLLVENSIQIDVLESFLYEFVGASEIADSNFILKAMKNCDIAEDKFDFVIELLCDLTFLGREVDEGRFKFSYNEDEKEKLKAMARKTIEKRENKTMRFRIHNAFHSYLEIIPVKD